MNKISFGMMMTMNEYHAGRLVVDEQCWTVRVDFGSIISER